MSTMNVSEILSVISSMEKQLALLRAQIAGGDAPAALPKSKKEKKTEKAEEKKPRAPTAWLLFTERVRGLLRENGYEKKALGPEMTKFCSELKKENGDLASWSSGDILARRAAWSAPAAAASVVSGPEEEEAAPASGGEQSNASGKKRQWSPEAKARAAEKRAAKKASSKTEDEAAPASDGEQSNASGEKKKRGPKAKKDMSPDELAAHEAKVAKRREAKKEEEKKAAPASPELPPLPPSPASSVGETTEEFRAVILNSKRYLVNLSNGHAYFREADGSQGDWAGLFKKTGGPKGGAWINDAVAEPLRYTDLEELD